MLMANETGNLAQVRNAVEGQTTPPLREQQRFPFQGWYVVIVRTRREQDLADEFRRLDIAAYWPNYTKQVPIGMHGGKRRHRVSFSAIIPGMIFCPLAEENTFWAAVQRVPYVVNLLRKEEGRPAILRNVDIEKLRQIEADANLPPEVTPIHNFKTGQKVRFTDEAPVQWPPGKVVRLAEDGRLTVEVYLMGRMVPMHGILPHQIEAA